MKASALILPVLLSLAIAQAADAADDASSFGVCLTDALSGKERKNLAKWIFFAMAAHPEIRAYANVSREDLDSSNKFVGELLTRLMTNDCPKLAMRALDEGGSRAFDQAFELVGQVAMQELMADPSVTQSLSDYLPYFDEQKLDTVDD